MPEIAAHHLSSSESHTLLSEQHAFEDIDYCDICSKPTDGGMFCSEACRILAARPSPAYSSGHSKTTPNITDDLIFDIPELDLGGSIMGPLRPRGYSGSTSARKSHSSRDTSSATSSPVFAPSDSDHYCSHRIPPLSDIVPPSSPFASALYSPHSTFSKAISGIRTPPKKGQGGVTSPSLPPMLRYTRRAFSTNVRAPTISQLHSHAPSSNNPDFPRPPDSAPPSSFTSPMLRAQDDTIGKKRSRNRRSLPLSLATITPPASDRSAAPHDPRYSQFILNSAVASALASGEYARVITPSHILSDHPAEWRPQKTQRVPSYTSGQRTAHALDEHSDSQVDLPTVLSSGTIKSSQRPSHSRNGSRLEGITHDGNLGRLISRSAAVTPISTTSAASASTSISISSSFSELSKYDGDEATHFLFPPETTRSTRRRSTQATFQDQFDEHTRRRSSDRRSSSGLRRKTEPVYRPTFTDSSSRGSSDQNLRKQTSSGGINSEFHPTRLSPTAEKPPMATPSQGESASHTFQQARSEITFANAPVNGRDTTRQSSAFDSDDDDNAAHVTQPVRVRRQTDGQYARHKNVPALDSDDDCQRRGRSRAPPSARVIAVQRDEERRRGNSNVR